MALQGHPVQQSGGVHDWLTQTPVSTVQPGMLVQPDADNCTLGRTLCILHAVERAANVLECSRSRTSVVMWSNFRLRSMIRAAALSTFCRGWALMPHSHGGHYDSN